MKLHKDRYYLGLSLVAALASFSIYYITKAPTVSFWDCGEFIATSYIMGIPHPPGYPLFVIIGRLFTMLPLAADIAVRINLISVLSSAASVFVAFWLILRLAIGKRESLPQGNSRIALGIGALAGSLIMGFAYTFWSNAIEAEVYGLAMLIMLILTYIALLWSDGGGKNDRYLIAISYLLWLSLGIHLTTFIIAVPLVLYMAYIDYADNHLRHWPIWVVMALFVLYSVPIQTQVLSIFGIDNSAFELESFFIIMGLAFLASLAMYMISRLRRLESAHVWGLTMIIMAFAALGYSNQAYIPVRAAEKPAINENDPSDWPRFKSFLERKQYGQESMITRMFRRRATWENQFISHPSFGLWRQLTEQYASPNAKLTLYRKGTANDRSEVDFGLYFWIVYVVLLGVGGMIEVFKRSRPNGSFIIFAMLLCTVGLVFYLNFSDGSRSFAPIAEVRDRDYFYTPGFIYYAILIGVGLSAFLEWLGKWGAGLSWRKGLFMLGLVGALLLPVHTAFANFDHNDRSGNYLPWDYAGNILQSCDKDGIVFTNGDNDTFPLWFIQEVAKVRTDVRVVNLSLLNTPWYIHQMKDQMGVPINLTYDQIEALRAVRFQDYGGLWRVQDQMVKEIILNSQANGWNPPVYFSMTVAPENRLGLEDHLIMEGMVYRVVDSVGQDRVNTDVGQRIFGDLAHFRGLADPNVRKDDNDRRLTANYISAMFRLVEAYQSRGAIDSALGMAEMAVRLRPPESMWQAKGYLAKMYARLGKYGKIDSLLAVTNNADGERIMLAVVQDLLIDKDYDRAQLMLKITLSTYPWSFTALNNLAAIYYQKNDSADADSLIADFRKANAQNAALMRSVDDMLRRFSQAPPGSSEVK
jgi:tetratricopeptide (TPR) repeat protein